MMQQMRDNTKWIMLITAAAFVGWMVFQGVSNMTGQTSAGFTGGEIGVVNGESISFQEYELTRQRLFNQQQTRSEDPLTAAENRRIEEAAWDQVIMDHLIRQEIERRGIQATAEEIRGAARFAPPPQMRQAEAFQTNGTFDIRKYHQFLASSSNNQRILLQLESYYRDVIPRSKLYQQVARGVFVTDGELWSIWRDARETATADYIVVDPAALVPDSAAAVTESEVRDYYEEHTADFQRSARAHVRVVAIEKTPTAADTAAARDRALDLRREILSGAEFGEVARLESADPASAEEGGLLGTVTPGGTVPAFDEAIWSLPVGEISEPVLTRFGYHIIRVESRGDEEAEVRHILLPIERTDSSEIALLERADSLEALGTVMTLEAVADTLGLRVREADLIKDGAFVPGIGRLIEGGEWAFQIAEPGDISLVYENPSAFYMIELVGVTPEHVAPLDEVEAEIRARLTRREKLAIAADLAREWVDEIRAGASLDEVAAANGLEVATAGPFTRGAGAPGLGRANAVIGAIFGMEPGRVSGVIEANDRLYIVRTTERTPADRATWEERKASQRAQITAAMEQQRLQAFLNDLRDSAEIVDNRAQLLQPVDPDAPPAGGLGMGF